MSDWYDKAEEEFLEVVSDQTQVDPHDVRLVFNYLYNEGVIDYNVMKEFLYVDDEDSE